MLTSMRELMVKLSDELGLNRQQELQSIAASYASAVPREILEVTKVASFRNGTLEIVVFAAPVLMELKTYHQANILAQLRRDHPGIRTIRFKVSSYR